MAADLIWYVSYGSNLSSARFRVYLEGGAAPGRAKEQVGARDRSSWRDDRAVVIDRRLVFAGASRWWGGGGVAYVDPSPSAARTRARAYLITVEQFQDVLAQESGRAVGTEVDLSDAIADGQAVLGDGHYDRVLLVGHERYPMLTFTTPRPIGSLRANPPSDAYAATIAAGLVESHAITPLDAHAYIAAHLDCPSV